MQADTDNSSKPVDKWTPDTAACNSARRCEKLFTVMAATTNARMINNKKESLNNQHDSRVVQRAISARDVVCLQIYTVC